MDQIVERIYRRMSEQEMKRTRKEQGLAPGRAQIGENKRSCTNKWVATNLKKANGHQPKNASKQDHQYLVEFNVVPGTIDALSVLKNDKQIRKSRPSNYGITEEYRDWFNNRVLTVNIYEDGKTNKEFSSSKDTLIQTQEGNIALFHAFSPTYIKKNQLSKEDLNMNRMTWIKTSLLWTIYRSDWARKDKQERIVEVQTNPQYLAELIKKSVKTKDPQANTSEVLYQKDPDRAILGKTWNKGQDNYWLSARRTMHLGIRGSELERYIDDIVPENLTDITTTIDKVRNQLPKHPTAALYNSLGYKLVPAEKLIKEWK